MYNVANVMCWKLYPHVTNRKEDREAFKRSSISTL